MGRNDESVVAVRGPVMGRHAYTEPNRGFKCHRWSTDAGDRMGFYPAAPLELPSNAVCCGSNDVDDVQVSMVVKLRVDSPAVIFEGVVSSWRCVDDPRTVEWGRSAQGCEILDTDALRNTLSDMLRHELSRFSYAELVGEFGAAQMSALVLDRWDAAKAWGLQVVGLRDLSFRSPSKDEKAKRLQQQRTAEQIQSFEQRMAEARAKHEAELDRLGRREELDQARVDEEKARIKAVEEQMALELERARAALDREFQEAATLQEYRERIGKETGALMARCEASLLDGFRAGLARLEQAHDIKLAAFGEQLRTTAHAYAGNLRGLLEEMKGDLRAQASDFDGIIAGVRARVQGLEYEMDLTGRDLRSFRETLDILGAEAMEDGERIKGLVDYLAALGKRLETGVSDQAQTKAQITDLLAGMRNDSDLLRNVLVSLGAPGRPDGLSSVISDTVERTLCDLFPGEADRVHAKAARERFLEILRTRHRDDRYAGHSVPRLSLNVFRQGTCATVLRAGTEIGTRGMGIGCGAAVGTSPAGGGGVRHGDRMTVDVELPRGGYVWLFGLGRQSEELPVLLYPLYGDVCDFISGRGTDRIRVEPGSLEHFPARLGLPGQGHYHLDDKGRTETGEHEKIFCIVTETSVPLVITKQADEAIRMHAIDWNGKTARFQKTWLNMDALERSAWSCGVLEYSVEE